MAEKYTKSELIKLKKGLSTLKESRQMLEERKKELYRLFRQMLAELHKREPEYDAQLGKVRDALLSVAKAHDYMEVSDDASIQPQGLCTLSEEVYMKGAYTTCEKMDFPDLKGRFVSQGLKSTFVDQLKALIPMGIALDALVKKASITRDEMKSVSRKLGYLQNIVIPRMEADIRAIEAMFEERRREELIKIKKFKKREKK